MNGCATLETEKSSISRDAMLLLVDFKWLMAGQGYWLDVARWGCDTEYRRHLVAAALRSENATVRSAALRLTAQTELTALPS